MKKLITLTLAVLISFSLFAKKVEIEEAKIIAKNHYSLLYELIKGNTIENLLIVESFTLTKDNEIVIYIFNFENGFTLVSATDVVSPVLGYSFEGKYKEENQPPAFIDLIEHYKSQISLAIKTKLESTDETISEWEFYSNPENLRSYGKCGFWPKYFSVNPLLTTLWNQNRWYNAKCPYDIRSCDSCNDHVFAGCVAIAESQVMKYWNYPVNGIGAHGYEDSENHLAAYGYQYANFGATNYDWINMPDFLTGSGPPNPTEPSSTSIDAVSTLIYHCGVSVDMDYGYGGSGAEMLPVRDGLVDYFDYSSTASYEEAINYSASEWDALLRSSLTNKMPIIYGGIDIVAGSGHAFVLDGYIKIQGQYMSYFASFHVNWGWSGNFNGYFTLSDLTPGPYAYNDSQVGVVGITPPNVVYPPPPQPSYISEGACYPHCREWEVEYFVPTIDEATSYEWDITEITAAGVYWNGRYATVYSHHTGTARLWARALNHGVPGPWQTRMIEIVSCEKSSESISGKVIHNPTQNILVNNAQISSDEILIFPNPAQNNIQINLPSTGIYLKIILLDLQGKVHRNTTIENKNIVINTDGLNNGVYIVKIISNHSIEMKKIQILK